MREAWRENPSSLQHFNPIRRPGFSICAGAMKRKASGASPWPRFLALWRGPPYLAAMPR